MNRFTRDYTCMYDDRSDGYRMVGDVLAHVARRCGVVIDETTYLRWRDIMGLVRDFDTFADESGLPRQEILAELSGFGAFTDRYPTLCPGVLEDEVRQEMEKVTAIILEIGDRLSQEQDINCFIELRKAEAYYTAQLFNLSATPEVRTQDGWNMCMWRFIGLGIGANLGDSLIDARMDYFNKKTKIKPTLTFYREVAYDAARHARRHAGTVLDLGGLALRSKMIAFRAMNRIQNGSSPHSNMQLLKYLPGMRQKQPKH